MESNNSKMWPLIRQFIVCSGVSLSTMEKSLVMGFTTIILPQLRQHPTIILDDATASWIASIVPIANIFGFLVILIFINKCGRRYANLISALLMVLGWTLVATATNIALILIGRFIQGVGMGISSLSSAILIGEYTTPKYRGAFLTMMTFTLSSGALVVHTVGSWFTWENTAYFCLGIAVTDAILVIYSPESPTFLAVSGKYDECRRVFRWLRGSDEEEELEAMIKKAELYKIARNETITSVETLKKKIILTIKKPEFYKPLIVMIHLTICNAWCGAIIMDTYGADIFKVFIGENVNVTFMLLTIDILRILSTVLATISNTKIKRRLIVKIFINLNILVYFLCAAYYYAKVTQRLPFDHSFIAAALLYLLTFINGAGTTPIVFVISGEIFPLKYKNICTAIDTLMMSFNMTLQLKTLPYLFSTVGLHGSFTIYGLLMAYGMIVALIMLPETKDMTLQNIEEVHWKVPTVEDFIKTESVELKELVKDKNYTANSKLLK